MPATPGFPRNGDAVDGPDGLYADGHDDDDDCHERLHVSNDESVLRRDDGWLPRIRW